MDAVLQTPSSVFFTEGSGLSSAQAREVIRSRFNLAKENELRSVSTTSLASGVVVEKFKQYFRGIVVEHSAYNVVSKSGVIFSVQAESYPLEASFSITPQLNAETAKGAALNYVRADKYAWDALEEDKRLFLGNAYIQAQLEALKQTYTPKGELVIAKDAFGSKRARLAYKFDVFAVQPMSRRLVYVDALTGKILLSDAVIKHADRVKKDPKPDSLAYMPNYRYYNLATKDQIRHAPRRTTASVTGTVLTRYAGTRQVYTTRITVPAAGAQDPNSPPLPLTYSGIDPRVPVTGRDVYILKDDTRGGGIETYDLNGVGGAPVSLPGVYSQALAFVDKDNNWKDESDNGLTTMEDHLRGLTRDGTIGANEAFNDDIAFDAHWGAGIVYDYWKQIHQRLSYDNKNSAIKSYVHYGPAYDNAFWNGSVMTYGDGSGTSVNGGFRPLTSLDVCGHEIGHGVCSNTADLVYQGESGAMNEALSDIWAAGIERFAKLHVDNTLNYQYFQIGEQIAADNVGLRRMDNPKAYSNPDTYGGRYWSDPNCTPTLANDECGVHNNSGVLNHWFYLLVQGPKTTTGSPVYTDDGRADAGTTTVTENLGNNYGILGPVATGGSGQFLGLGFDKAEQITYLMELTLTPNATYAEARVASINAAKVLYGVCSQEVISATDAWYAVNVGPAWAGCTAPTLSVNLLTTTVNEGSGDCGSYTDYTVGISLTVPQLTATTVAFSTGSGTAEVGDDYQLMGTSASFAAGETGNKSVVLRVYNDDMVEGDETIVLNAVSTLGAFNFTQTITIADDDVLPKLGNTFTLLTENFESVADDALPSGWAKVNKTNPAGGEWNVRQSPAVSTLSWTTKRAYVYNPTLAALTPAVKGQALYDPTVASNAILRTPQIDGRGLDSINLRFVWSAGGEAQCSPACDYGEVVYSFDGVNFNRFDADPGSGGGSPSRSLYISLTDSTYNMILGQQVANKRFYLGFRWVNDDLLTMSPNSITIDNVVVTGQGRKIESDFGATVTTPVHVENGKPVYFYSKNDKGLLSSIMNASADLGCVTDTLIESGNGTVAYSGGRRTRKVHEITPSQNSNGTYTLTLYYTRAELSGFVASPSQLKILKSNASNIDLSNASNSLVVTPNNFIDSSAQGFYGYTYTFNGFSKFALTEASSAPLPVTCIGFKANRGTNSVGLDWSVGGDVQGGSYAVERSSDGASYQPIATVKGNGGGRYSFNDADVQGLKAAYYRIKATEPTGASRYLCTVLYVGFGGHNLFTIGNVYPNPGKSSAVVNVTLGVAHNLRIEYMNAVGQVVSAQQAQLSAGASQLTLNVGSLASGTYLIRFRNEDGSVVGTQQFNKL